MRARSPSLLASLRAGLSCGGTARGWTSKWSSPPCIPLLLVMILAGTFFSCVNAPLEAPPASTRQPVLLTAEVSRAEAAVAETLTYTLTLDAQPELPVTLPEVFSKIEGFKVTDIRREEPRTRDGRRIERQIFSLQALEAGSYILPAVEVQWSDASGELKKAGAPQIFVEIKSNFQEGDQGSDIADIKELEQPPPDYRRMALLGGGLVLLLGLVGAAVWWSRRKKRALAAASPPIPPWDAARQALAELEARGLLERGDAHGYCFELSEIFRRYLELRFAVPALEGSTEEILSAFRHSPVPQGRPQDMARRILQHTDRVKFARHEPSRADAEELLSLAREFVAATEPPPPVSEAEGHGKEGP